MSETHGSFISTPKQLAIVVTLAIIVPVVLILMIVSLVIGARKHTDSPERVVERVKPIGTVRMEAPAAAADAKARSGEQIVQMACGKCHQSGEMGAPRIGDRAAWTKRLGGGLDAAIASAIKGHGQMPARGGFADINDAEIRNAIVHMYQASGVEVGTGGTVAAPGLKPGDTPAPREPLATVAPTPAPATASPAPAAVAPAPATSAAAPAGAAPAAAAKGGAADAKKVYDTVCAVCHATGVANAPKTGDKAAWAPRIKTGTDALYASALKGKGAMPAKGGNTALSDAEVKAAVDYLVAQSK